MSRRTLTPQLRTDARRHAAACSSTWDAVATVSAARASRRCTAKVGAAPADLDAPQLLQGFVAAMRDLKARDLVLAYHDRSDGGVLVTLLEMAFAGHCGLDVRVPTGATPPLAALCAEELGAVVQVRNSDMETLKAALALHGLDGCAHDIGAALPGDEIRIVAGDQELRAVANATAAHLVGNLLAHAAPAGQSRVRGRGVRAPRRRR